MIPFKHPEEKKISLFYAEKLEASVANSVLEKEEVNNQDEARALAKFYWDMVNLTIKERDSGVDHGFGDMDMWLEYICNSLFFFLSNNGYEEEWDEF